MMDEEELRALVRQAVRRRLGTGPVQVAVVPCAAAADPAPAPLPIAPVATSGPHPSQVLLPVFTGRASDGSCLIEPVVVCEHCRFCQSFGH
jgi:hypothetical protein